MHRETGAAPVDRLAVDRGHLHPLPTDPHTAALGEERLVNEDQTVRVGSVRYSTPPGHVGTRVWCRAVGEELVIVAMTPTGTTEIARHVLSTPGNPRIVDAHYPHHPGGNHPRPRPRSQAEAAFLAIGDGAHAWLVEAGATGTSRVGGEDGPRGRVRGHPRPGQGRSGPRPGRRGAHVPGGHQQAFFRAVVAKLEPLGIRPQVLISLTENGVQRSGTRATSEHKERLHNAAPGRR